MTAIAIIGAMDKAIAGKRVTYDFARLMEGATEVKCAKLSAPANAAVIDVSPLYKYRLSGPDALRLADRVIT